jgi:cysteinyl-tRNA synthetase
MPNQNPIKLIDTYTNQVLELKAHSSDTIYMYVCGITPYDNTHLGHARTFSSIDILRRYIEYKGQKIYHIQNVTDIDDKIINRAKEKNTQPLILADFYDKKSRQELKKLNILPPHHMPKVSESINLICDFIQKILDNNFAYITKSGIYFDVYSYQLKIGEYGGLSKQDLEKIKAGARIEPKEDKKQAVDFALWKFEKELGATFSSKWGEGRPGWHIECSAMAMSATKGKPLDLHAGARDLIFPHHENEIAQSHAAGYKPFCYHWLHTGFLTVNGEKMAKSLGNFITLEETLEKWEPDVIRLFFAFSHYSSPLDFSKDAIEGVKNTYYNIKNSLFFIEQPWLKMQVDQKNILEIEQKLEKTKKAFSDYMDNNLDTTRALAELIQATKELSLYYYSGKIPTNTASKLAQELKILFKIFGLENLEIKLKLPLNEIYKKVELRQIARQNKDFQTSDNLRKELLKNNIALEDTPSGTIIKPI